MRVARRICVVPIVACMGGQVVNAQELPASPGARSEARRMFEDGVARASRRDLEGARRSFAASYELDPLPEALFALAQSERLLGRCDLAVPHYERFLGLAPRPNDKQAAELALGRCRSQPTPAAAEAPPAPAPSPPSIAAAPKAAGEPPSHVLPWTLAGGAVVALGAATTLFLLSAHHADEAPQANTFRDYADRSDAARLERGLALGVGAVGVAAALGAAWWVWRHPTDGADVRVSFDGVTLSGRF